MKVAKVYIEYGSLKVNRPFDYLVPENINITKGVRVFINFNHAKIVGYVVDVYETHKSEEELNDEFGYELKYIEKVLDDKPLINDEIEEIVHYLQEETMSSLIKCYQTVLPPSLKPSRRATILTEPEASAMAGAQFLRICILPTAQAFSPEKSALRM